MSAGMTPLGIGGGACDCEFQELMVDEVKSNVQIDSWEVIVECCRKARMSTDSLLA